MKYDVFISHASEDKGQVASPLAHELRARGYSVWFDGFSLSLGDSLSRSIDAGLATTRFGVVVLSKNFFAKHWPERELAGLVARETHSGRKTVLPIWHNVTHDDVVRYSPVLADRLAVSTSVGMNVIADQVSAAIDAARADEVSSSGIGSTQPFTFSPIDLGEAHRASRLQIQSISPAPGAEPLRMRARVPLSASVAYHVSARVEDAFITLEVNRVPERGRPWHNMVEKRVRAPSGTVTLRGTLPDSLIEETDVRSIEVRATLVLVNDDTGLRHSILKSNSITFATAA